MIWLDIVSHIHPEIFKRVYDQGVHLLNRSDTFISHQNEILRLFGILAFVLGRLKERSLTEKLQDRLEEWYRRRRISPIQKEVFKNLFKEKDSYSGVHGTDIRRPGVAVKAHEDRYRWGELLQMDIMSLTEFDEILQKAGIARRPKEERMAESGYNFNELFMNRNLHSAGGPVPCKTTAEIMRVFPLRFDLSHPNYPLYTLRQAEEPYEPDYDEKGKEYHSDFGVIIVSSNPRDNTKKALATFGCHGYGSLAAAKAITLDKHFKNLDCEYDISEIDEQIIKSVYNGLKGNRNFYIVVEAKIEKGEIESIKKCEGPVYDTEWFKADLERFKQLSKDGKPL